jgi:adenine-specific DNA-methyltransferase
VTPVVRAVPDPRHPFLSTQLIAYIGNKRALLPFLAEAFASLAGTRRRVTFLDPFAGSGSVSRLARLMGFAVAANDWEPYAFVINSCHLGISASRLPGLFRDRGGPAAVLAGLNALPAPSPDRRYVSRHYAPRSTREADWRTERLFYTTENALAIDAIRWRIEEMYPGDQADPDARDEKNALLAALLYEAATHTNTSGVFKACHRGFGGHGGDALGRILAPITLEAPVLADCTFPSEVRCEDARSFLAQRRADICYLDPPYAVHQYGSNYFMLNTIALWDRPAVDDRRGPDGRLLSKAGIRADWVETRSRFCSPATAAQAFREVASAADCRHLAVSYSNEGLVGLEELCDILSETGRLEVRTTGYVKYPGGKQSLRRQVRNVEMLLVADRSASATSSSRREARRRLSEARLAGLLERSFSPRRIRQAFPGSRHHLAPGVAGTGPLPMRWSYRFDDPPAAAAALAALPAAERDAIEAGLAGCLLSDSSEEIEVLLSVLRREKDPARRRALLARVLRLLNRFAHRKYRSLFERSLFRLRAFAASDPSLGRFAEGLERIAERARRRIAAPEAWK